MPRWIPNKVSKPKIAKKKAAIDPTKTMHAAVGEDTAATSDMMKPEAVEQFNNYILWK